MKRKLFWLGSLLTLFAGASLAQEAPSAQATASTVPSASYGYAVASSIDGDSEVVLASDRRHGRSGHRYRYRSRHRSYGYWGYSGWPYWGGYWGGYWGSPWGPPRYYLDSDAGGIDINVKPKKASVYVDGEYMGTVGNFDGFPRYLWLGEGAHQLVIHYDGYKTLVRNLEVEAGIVLEVNGRLAPGESEPPEAYFKEPETVEKSPAPRAEARERRGPRPGFRGEWRERRRAIERDQREEPASLNLTVSPSDAVVYLDGRLIGSGEELARLHAGLVVDAGRHTLEVTRPGYKGKEVEFEAEAGETVDLDVKLTSSQGSV